MNANENLNYLLGKADEPGRPVYLLTVADILEVMAEVFEQKGWDITTLSKDEIDEIIYEGERLLEHQDEYPGNPIFEYAVLDHNYKERE